MLASVYGLQCLEAVLKIPEVEVAGIVTPPKEYVLYYEKGKKRTQTNEILNQLQKIAGQNKIPLYVMNKMNHPETIDCIRRFAPELIIVSGWYHLIGKEILGIPPKGVIGLHGSLLPKYKGGAPLVWQIINGEEYAGITLFYMTEETDSGDIIAQAKVEIKERDTISTLYDKVGQAGIHLLKENLPLLSEGRAPRRKQELEQGSVYSQRTAEDGHICWSDTAENIYNFIRAQTRPYPGAFSLYEKNRIHIWSAEIVDTIDMDTIPGEIISVKEEYFDVVAKEKAVRVLEWTIEGENMGKEFPLVGIIIN